MPSVWGGGASRGTSSRVAIPPPPKRKSAPSLIAQARQLVSGAPRAVVGLAGVAARDVYRGSPLDDIVEAVQRRDASELLTHDWLFPGAEQRYRAYRDTRETGGGVQDLLDRYAQESPLAGEMARSVARTGQRLYQTGYAALPGGTPFGENPYSQASREGTILGTVLEDVGNAALVAAPAVKALGAGATRAAAEATAARTAMSAAAKDFRAALTARDAARAAAAVKAGDPAAAAQVAAADAQAAAAREAFSQARQAAVAAQERAARRAVIARRAERVLHLGNRAADSPFAPFAFAGRQVVAPLLRAAAHTPAGQRVGGFLADLAERAETRYRGRKAVRETQPLLEELDAEQSRANQQIARGGKRANRLLATTEERRSVPVVGQRRRVPVADDLANRAVTLLLTGEAQQLARLREAGIDRDRAIELFAEAQRRAAQRSGGGEFTPDVEAIGFAYDVLDPNATGRAAEVRNALPEIERAWREEISEPAARRYLAMEGEEPELVTPERRAGREQNVYGTEPTTEHLTDFQRRQQRLEKRRERQAKRTARAEEKFARAAERLEGLGLSEAERANPRALLERVQEPAIRLARAIVDRPGVLAELAATPELGAIARRAMEGRLPAERAISALADRLIELSGRDRAGMSEPVARLLTLLEPPPARMPRLADVGPARQLGAAEQASRTGAALAQQGARDVARGENVLARFEERVKHATRDNRAKVMSAARRVARAGEKLRELRTRAENARRRLARQPDEAFAPSRAEAKAAVREAKAAIRELRKAVRDADQQYLDLLDQYDARYVAPPPPKARRGGEWDAIMQAPFWLRRRIIRKGGLMPDEIESILREVGLLGETEGLDVWVDNIERALRGGRLKVDDVAAALGLADQPDLVRSLMDDRIDVATERWMTAAAAARRAEAEAGVGRVAEAREMDIEREIEGFGSARPGRAALSEGEQVAYDAETAAARAEQGERILAFRERQLGERAAEGAERAREQGRAEGELAGRGRTLVEVGERAQAQGARMSERARETLRMTAELEAEATRRVSGPIGRIYRKVGRHERAVADAAREYAREVRALERLDQRMLRARQEALNSIEANPSRYRPVIAIGRELASNLREMADELDQQVPGSGDVYRAAAAEVIVNAKELVDAGIDPIFLIGRSRSIPPSITRRAHDYAPGAELPVGGATGGQQVRRTGVRHGQTLEELVAEERRRVNRIIANKTGQKIQERVGRSIRSILLDRGMTAEQIDRMSGPELRAAIEDTAGGKQMAWAAWDPHAASREYGSLLGDGQLTPDTVVIPMPVWKEFRNYAEGRFGDEVARIDRFMRVWKGGVLALTGRWHAGNVIGNAILAMFGGGVAPPSYWRQIRRAHQILKATERGIITPEYQQFLDQLPPQVREALVEGRWAPPELLRRGMSASDWQRISFPEELSRRRLRHPVETSYRLNGWIDDLNRLAVYLEKVERGLRDVDIKYFKEQHPEFAHLSRAEIEREAAIRLSLRALGDFTKLTPFERKIVKRWFLPFYPWLRHITKLTGNLAIHHPLRVTWTLHLVDLFDGDEESTLPWLLGAIPLGGDRYLRLPNINPFQDVFGALAVGDEGYEPEGLFGSVSPVLSTAAAATTGLDIRNLSTLRRAVPGTDQYGRERGQPLLFRPKELGYYLGSQVPQVDIARQVIPQLWGSQPIRRYPTGEPVVVNNRFIRANEQLIPGTDRQMPGMIAPLIPLLGIPRVEQIDTEAIEARAAERKSRVRKQKSRYDRSRARAKANARRGRYAE